MNLEQPQLRRGDPPGRPYSSSDDEVNREQQPRFRLTTSVISEILEILKILWYESLT